MSSTAAVDAMGVGDWERESIAAAAEKAAASISGHSDHPDIPGVADRGAEVPVPAWPPRRLNDALAGLGPVRPGARANVEPWSRAVSHSGHSSATSQLAADGEAGNENVISAWSLAEEGLSSVAGLSSIPPPPRPSRPLPTFEPVGETRPAVIGDLANTSLAEFDVAGVELVRALAAADLARERGSLETAHPPVTDMDLMEPAPIIIERARAEQELGVVPAPPVVPWNNPLRGLAIGFSLALVAGVALYMVLTGG